MKKTAIMLIITASLMTIMCDQKQITIKTNYYDLPAAENTEFRKTIKTDKNNNLTSESAGILKSFLSKTVLKGESPFGPFLTSSYFWHIYHALPSFVDKKEIHHGYYNDEKKPEPEERMLAYACYRIDRSPENLKKIFTIAKPFLKETVSQKDYRRMQADNFVNGLVMTYERLERIKDYDIKLAEFYSSRYTPSGAMRTEVKSIKKIYNDPYGYSSLDISEELSKLLGIDKYSALYGSPNLSFWMRRNKEGNMDTVYSMLKEIQQIYNR